jgi:hypothetical protein
LWCFSIWYQSAPYFLAVKRSIYIYPMYTYAFSSAIRQAEVPSYQLITLCNMQADNQETAITGERFT